MNRMAHGGEKVARWLNSASAQRHCRRNAVTLPLFCHTVDYAEYRPYAMS